MITFDAHELVTYGEDLGKIGFRATGVMVKEFQETGDELVDLWAGYARASSGVHGKHYPDSIDKEMQLSTNIVLEVGPNPTKPQGKMAFETGSVNQPPHPDGQRAADVIVPRLQLRIAAALGHLGL